MKKVITYGTFDLLHYGHVELLRRAYELSGGAGVIVGVSTDSFNSLKGKKSHQNYQERVTILSAIKYVKKIIPEQTWDQKEKDIKEHNIDLFIMGDDWKGRFDHLKQHCDVTYLRRTPAISSSVLKNAIKSSLSASAKPNTA